MNNPNLNPQSPPDRNLEGAIVVVNGSIPVNNGNQNQPAVIQIPPRRASHSRYPSSCCLCFRIHQGFINIVYLDIARFFWGIIFGAMIYARSTSITIDYVSASVTIVAILLQSFYAAVSVKRALPINNYVIFKRYFLCKVFYICAAFFENIIKNIIICKAHLRPSTQSEDCTTNSLGGEIAMDVCWLTVESYFAFIVYVFYAKTRRGDYGTIGSPPNYGDQLSSFPESQQSILEAIEVEVQGLQIKSLQSVQTEKNKEEQIKKSVPLSQDQLLGPRSMTIYRSKNKFELNEVMMVDLTAGEEEGIAIIITDPQQAEVVIKSKK